MIVGILWTVFGLVLCIFPSYFARVGRFSWIGGRGTQGSSSIPLDNAFGNIWGKRIVFIIGLTFMILGILNIVGILQGPI